MNDYQSFVRTICSPRFELSSCTQEEIVSAFSHFIAAAKELDRIKRAIFYGKTEPSEWAADAPTRTVNFEQVHQDAFHAIIGICTEAGELAERLLLMAESPNDPHRVNLIEELGDLAWYKALLQAQLGVDSIHVEIINRSKLTTRYSKVTGFEASRAVVRDLAAEQRALTE